MKIIAQVKLEKQELVDLLSTAFYGNPIFGCDYTDELVNYKKSHKDQFKDMCYEDVMAEWLFLNPNNTIEVDDPEEDKTYYLTLSQIEKGYGIYLQHPYEDQIYVEDMDLIGADCVIQCALFGEVIYG